MRSWKGLFVTENTLEIPSQERNRKEQPQFVRPFLNCTNAVGYAGVGLDRSSSSDGPYAS